MPQLLLLAAVGAIAWFGYKRFLAEAERVSGSVRDAEKEGQIRRAGHPDRRSGNRRIPAEKARRIGQARTATVYLLHPTRSFQGLILALHRYWADYGCVVLQPYDMEVGAGTFHPATTLARTRPESRGTRPMCSPRAGPRTAATAKTPTGCSTITSTR
jgi:hypothetical protein